MRHSPSVEDLLPAHLERPSPARLGHPGPARLPVRGAAPEAVLGRFEILTTWGRGWLA